MTDDNYMKAIREAQNLLNELLNDPDYGELTFEGLSDLDDLTVTRPCQLNDVISGTVLAIGTHEWMALNMGMDDSRLWQSFRAGKCATNEELYLLALKRPNELNHCHAGL